MQSNQCLTCIHYYGAQSCEAFGLGVEIPRSIYIGDVIHDKKLFGELFTFELNPKAKSVSIRNPK